MPSALINAVASSSAHGISRAATSKARPLQLMWIILFLVFLAMFLKSGISLVLKLLDNKLTKVYHLDQTPFVFPDLYFCPNNPYSGSYPFMLTKEEADLANAEVAKIIIEGEIKNNFSIGSSTALTKAYRVQLAYPFHLLQKYFMLRKKQSILKSVLTSHFVPYSIELEDFYTPENLICFKTVLSDNYKRKMASPSSEIEIWLSTDPYFSDFNFTGHPILPFEDLNGRSIPFLSWHPKKIVEDLKVSGFTMLIVPPGMYPSMKFESNFHLAPGNSYTVKLQMEEKACSEELHETHCINDHPEVTFTNPLTRVPEPFQYSSAACYYLRRNSVLVNQIGCQMSMHPSPGAFRNWPRCLNVSELSSSTIAAIREISATDIVNWEQDANRHCWNKIPCSFPHYSAAYSFGKWPSIGSSTDHYFANSFIVNEVETPALAKLVKIAQQIQGQNHSAHLESVFRSYVSESLVSVRISVESMMSPQVKLTWSYTFTDFLADTGGLLGLYIGCSVLTLCELLELLYVLVEHAMNKRSSKTGQPEGPEENIEC